MDLERHGNERHSLKTGELAHTAGVGVETVRFYERKGLLPEPPRRPSGYRMYPPAAVGRLRFIRRARELGFSLREIDQLLTTRSASGRRCERVQNQLAAKIADVEGRIADLRRVRDALVAMADDCESQDDAGCPFLKALGGTAHGATR